MKKKIFISKKIKGLIVASAITLASLGLFTACVDEGPGSGGSAQTDNQETVQEDNNETPEEITLRWAVWDTAGIAYYEPLVEGYKEIAPNVTIELVDLGAAEYDTILQSQLIGGADYDVIKIRNTPAYVHYQSNGLIIPLDELITEVGMDISAHMDTIEQFQIDEETYAVPFRKDFWLLYYNKDLFDAAGVDYPTNHMTFDEWVEVIKAVAHGEGTDRVWGNHFHVWPNTVQLLGVLDGKTTIADGNYDFLIPYYEAVLALEDGDYIPRRTDLAAGGIHHSSTWLNQQIAMLHMGSWFIPTAIEGFMEEGINWGLATYPVPDASHAGNALGTHTQLAIPRTATQVEESMKFIDFVSGTKGAALLSSVGQFPAIMTDEALAIFTSAEGFPQDEQSLAALLPTNIVLEMPFTLFGSDINTIQQEAHQEIMDRTMTIEEAIDMMNHRIGSELMGL